MLFVPVTVWGRGSPAAKARALVRGVGTTSSKQAGPWGGAEPCVCFRPQRRWLSLQCVLSSVAWGWGLLGDPVVVGPLNTREDWSLVG